MDCPEYTQLIARYMRTEGASGRCAGSAASSISKSSFSTRPLFAVSLGRLRAGAAQPFQLIATLTARIIEHLDRALLHVERQPGEDLHPGGDWFKVIGQFGEIPIDSSLAVIAAGHD